MHGGVGRRSKGRSVMAKKRCPEEGAMEGGGGGEKGDETGRRERQKATPQEGAQREGGGGGEGGGRGDHEVLRAGANTVRTSDDESIRKKKQL
jgi:hypothetical protein